MPVSKNKKTKYRFFGGKRKKTAASSKKTAASSKKTRTKTCLYKYKCDKTKRKKQRCVYTYICPPPSKY